MTGAVIVVVELLARASISTPNLGVLLLLGVLYATFAEGLRSGIASGVLAVSYYAFYESTPGSPLHYTPGNLERVLTTSGAVVAGVAFVGHLRHRISALLARGQALQAEAESSASRLRDILESITDGFIAIDHDWRYTYLNPKAEQLIGRRRDTLLGKTIWEAFPPLVGSTWEREYRRAVAARVTVHFEEYYAPLDAWFETRAYPSPAGLTIYLSDVTARKRMEQELAKRLRQQATIASLGLAALRGSDLQKLLDDAVRAVATGLDVELTKVLELSDDGSSLHLRAGVGWREGAATKPVGTGRDSQEGYTLQSDAPVIVEDLRAEKRFGGPDLLVEHGVVSGMSVVIDGGERPFGILGAHTRKARRFTEDDIHFLQAAANVVADAVQRHHAMRELTESEARFRLLAETVHDAFFITDFETGRDEYVSPAYEKIWGTPYDQAGASWRETVHPEDRAEVARQLDRAAPDEAHEYRILRADGSVRWVSSQAFPVRTSSDEPARRVVRVVRDVTDRKNAEDNARRLQHEQLARATAEAGLRARDDVLALVSHDLRNPLNTILMSAEMLKQSTNDRAMLGRLGAIARAALRMSRLVEDLLDVARIEAGKMSLCIEPMDVTALFREAHEALEAQALERGVRLEIGDACEKIPLVAADRDRVLRVVLNLAGNAIKFTPPGGRVALDAELEGGRVVVRVSDSGPGIPEEDRSHLFRPFWQGRSSDPRGAGLGLAIAQGIVHAHHERIWVCETSGGGARIAFSLSPVVTTPASASLHVS